MSHAEFPKMLYKHGHTPKLVHSHKEQEEAEGFGESPVTKEPTAKEKGSEFTHANPTKEERGIKEVGKVEVVNATVVHGADAAKGGDPVVGLKDEKKK